MNSTTYLAQKIEHAITYLCHGWRCFVLSAQKKPLRNCATCPPHGVDGHDGETCTCLTCHGFYAATDDPNRIIEMICEHPDGMLAVRTGAPSGLVVLDMDDRHGGYESLCRLEAAVGVLPGTVMQNTPGGLHMLYAHPGHHVKSAGPAFGKDMPGLDVKGDGGYFVVAPSVNEAGKAYSWVGGISGEPLPPWPDVLSRLSEPERPRATRTPISDANRLLMSPGSGSGAGYAATALRAEVQRVLDTGPVGSGVNNALNTAAFNLGQLIAGGQLDLDSVVQELTDAALSVGMPARDIGDQYRGTLGSGLRAGMASPRGGAA